MSKLTPAQEYGLFLGDFQRRITEMFKQIAQGFQLGTNPPEQLTLEQRDALVERKQEKAFQRRIEAERQIGLRFVRKEARRVREELGLNDHNHTNV